MGLEKYVSFSKQNRQINLCENIFHSAKEKKREKKTENERFGFLHSKKTQDKNHQTKKRKRKLHIEMLIFQFYMSLS